jgi:hypothetical protein
MTLVISGAFQGPLCSLRLLSTRMYVVADPRTIPAANTKANDEITHSDPAAEGFAVCVLLHPDIAGA